MRSLRIVNHALGRSIYATPPDKSWRLVVPPATIWARTMGMGAHHAEIDRQSGLLPGFADGIDGHSAGLQ
jgi:hypothetical protein